MEEKEIQAADGQPGEVALPEEGAVAAEVPEAGAEVSAEADADGSEAAAEAVEDAELAEEAVPEEETAVVDGTAAEVSEDAPAADGDGSEEPAVDSAEEAAEEAAEESAEEGSEAAEVPEESEPGEVAEPEEGAGEEEPEPQAFSAEELLGDSADDKPTGDAEILQLKAVLEAIVYILNEPMPAAQIAQALDRPLIEVEPLLRQLAEETARADRGVFIREVAGGYQMATKPEHHEVIRTFVKNLKQPLKLSQAALETLAVIAYKQPITMPEILEIRGVQGGGVVKTLIDRKLITSAGRKNVVGKPTLYKTTKEFLTQFGLKDVHELPSLKEFEELTRQSIADEEIQEPAQAALVEHAAPAERVSESTSETAPEPVESAEAAAPVVSEVTNEPAAESPDSVEPPQENG